MNMRPRKLGELYRPFKGSEIFRRLATRTAHGVGHPLSFVAALLVVILWAVSGRFFGFSDTWQLVINTGTTIVTFLMVFLIQNTQNRDSHAIHLKLDELIRANKHARDRMMALEELSEEELDELQQEFARLARAKVAESRERSSSMPPPPPSSEPRERRHGGAPKESSKPRAASSRTRSRSPAPARSTAARRRSRSPRRTRRSR